MRRKNTATKSGFEHRLSQICPADIVVVYKFDRPTRAHVASAAPWFAPDSSLEQAGFEPLVPPSLHGE